MATCAAGTLILAILSACQDASLTGAEDPKAALTAQGAVAPDIRPDFIPDGEDSTACHGKDLNIPADCQDETSTVVVPVDDGTEPILPSGLPDFAPSEGEIGQPEAEINSVSAPVPDTTKYAHGGPIFP